MPLDTSTTYRLTRLRLDGRRWNELRLVQAQISTNPASSGSSYLAMGNTVVVCNVHGPAEGKRSETAGGGGGAVVSVVVNIAGFAGVDRKKKSMMAGGGGGGGGGGDSTISVHVSVLSSDGSIFAACINACTLALVDAGIPMPGLLCACTVGMSGRASTPAAELAQSRVGGINESLDPLLDLSRPEELELPHMTVANTNPVAGASEEGEEEEQMLSIVRMESGVHISYLETMFAVGIDGCRRVLEGETGYHAGMDMEP
ncbi:exosome complex exonuclease RRP41 [Coccidioides immitis H538.4]|uniref:Exosome complex exonuclease RRP41 n=1 Tax=Coccidioides immitis H538.4 TaxID=396776 RepID=A0A0J8RZZ7_COCIT|nr:exosome complex exonuclease RRP41 [Coccidioides immitis H538.4]